MKGIGHAFSNFGSSKQQTTHLFQVGRRSIPSRIEVNQANDKVTLGIVACDSCNNTDPPTFFKADVIFLFAKGYLATANPPQVMDTIAQVFTVDDSGGGDQQGGARPHREPKWTGWPGADHLRTSRPRSPRPFNWDKPSTKWWPPSASRTKS